jgi:hypothetical protein
VGNQILWNRNKDSLAAEALFSHSLNSPDQTVVNSCMMDADVAGAADIIFLDSDFSEFLISA